MNTFFKQFSCFLFILFFTCSQIEARDSKFFHKYIHLSSNNNNKNYVTVPSTVQSSAPAPAPAPLTSQISNAPAPLGAEIGDVPMPTPAPAPAPIESDNAYYGLYGKGSSSDQFPFKTTSTTTTTEGGDDEFSTEEFRMENFNEVNSRESNNYNNNFYPDNYNNNGYSKSNIKGNTVDPQGMSDTRSLENGKYYYDIKNENYNPNSGYEPMRETSNEEGYYNQKSKYEFDSMEEYEKKNNYADVQTDQYIP